MSSAADLMGKGTEEAAEILHSRYGKDVGLMIIGPGGEKQYATAAILNSDRDGFRPGCAVEEEWGRFWDPRGSKPLSSMMTVPEESLCGRRRV